MKFGKTFWSIRTRCIIDGKWIDHKTKVKTDAAIAEVRRMRFASEAAAEQVLSKLVESGCVAPNTCCVCDCCDMYL